MKRREEPEERVPESWPFWRPPGRARRKQGGSNCQIKKPEQLQLQLLCLPQSPTFPPHLGLREEGNRAQVSRERPETTGPRFSGGRDSTGPTLRGPGAEGCGASSEGMFGGGTLRKGSLWRRGLPDGGSSFWRPGLPPGETGRAPRRGSHAGQSSGC